MGNENIKNLEKRQCFIALVFGIIFFQLLKVTSALLEEHACYTIFPFQLIKKQSMSSPLKIIFKRKEKKK
jgi:hypothetical protein